MRQRDRICCPSGDARPALWIAYRRFELLSLEFRRSLFQEGYDALAKVLRFSGAALFLFFHFELLFEGIFGTGPEEPARGGERKCRTFGQARRECDRLIEQYRIVTNAIDQTPGQRRLRRQPFG